MSALGLGGQAHAEAVRITYAEPLRLNPTASSSQTQAQTATRSISFDAFGRRFELDLERNEPLLAEVQPRQLQQLDDFELLRGKIRGNAASWVRLSLVNGQYIGAIWDGAELYAIDPSSALQPHLEAAPSSAGGTLIYRLSDSYGGVNGGTCATKSRGATARRSALGGYKALVQELQQSAALVGTHEITVAILADREFADRYGTSSMEQMLARMNIVDGIFDVQVGVNIVAAEFTAFSGGSDPFTATNSDSLLDQLSAYRASTPPVASRGLAHLLTGKELDGGVLGIGYIGALCTVETGVALSEELGTATQTALVIAHELGHNFGAEHDGQAGSVCSSTPQTFLMGPFFNGSNTFSQCSRNTMAQHVAQAACVTPARVRDVALSSPTSLVTGVPNQAIAYAVDVSSVGEETAHNIVVSAEFGSGLVVQSASLDGGQCSVSGRIVNCQLPELAANEVRRLNVQVSASSIGTYSSTVTATSSVDQISTNNVVQVPIEIQSVFDASIALSPESISVVSGEVFALTATVTATGVGVLNDAIASVHLYGFNVISIESSAGACTQSSSVYSCALGSLAPGESMSVAMQLSAIPGIFSRGGSVSVAAASQPSLPLRTVPLDITVSARTDLAIDPLPYEVIAAVGELVEVPVVFRSVGAAAMSNARVTVSGNNALELELIGENITCTDAGWLLDCSLGRLDPGTVVNATLRLRSNDVRRDYITIETPFDSEDEVSSNSDRMFTLDIRPEIDVVVPEYSSAYLVYDGVETTVSTSVGSIGVRAATQVNVAVTLPESFTLVSARADGAQCTSAGRVATCEFAAIEGGQFRAVDITFIANELGAFSASVAVSALEDVDAANNSASVNFEVRANADAHIVLPEDRHAFVGEAEDWVFSVVNGRYALVDSTFDFDLNTNIVIESINASRGACTHAGYVISCTLGTLEPNEVVTVTLRATFTSEYGSSIYPTFYSPADVNSLNNYAQAYFTIDVPGDIALVNVPGSLTATVGQRTSLSFDVTALARGEEPYIEFDFDPARVLEPEPTNAFDCDWAARPVRCRLFVLYTGETHFVGLDFTPSGVGESSIGIRIGARNDRNTSNDEATVLLTIAADTDPAPPTQPRPPSSSRGGGGGGGATIPAHLLALLALLLLRRGHSSSSRRVPM